jgi:hypothetical protein
MSQAYVPRSEQVKTAPESPIEGQKVWQCELADFVDQRVTLPEVALRVTEVVAVYQAALPALPIGLGGQNLWPDLERVYTPASQPVRVTADGETVGTYTSFALEAQPLDDTLRHTVTLTWPPPTFTHPVTGALTTRDDLPPDTAQVTAWLVFEGPLPTADYALVADAENQLKVLHVRQHFDRLLPLKALCVYYTAEVAPGFVRE